MRTHFPKAVILAATLFTICSACKKNIQSTSPQNEAQISSDDEVSLSTEGSNLKLTLRPGPNSGQDANVLYFEGHTDQMNANFNYQNELETVAWTDGGYNVIRRSLIRFDSLAKVPTTATVVSAELYLYGLNTSVEAPQGNSYCPGSPYNGYADNTCYVERIVGGLWYENTVTWNNQPLVTEKNRAVVSPSTSQWSYDVAVDVTKLAQPIVQNPQKNYGFRINLQSETIYRSMLFYTSEANDKSKRPKLVVIYQ